MEHYRQIIVRLIERTKNPATPFVVQNLATGLEQTARVIAPLCDQVKVAKHTERLMSAYTDKDLGKFAKDPNFLLALLAMTKESLIRFGVDK